MSELNNRPITIVLRQGLAANLGATGTILQPGEPAYTTDTKKLYIQGPTGSAPTLIGPSGGVTGPTGYMNGPGTMQIKWGSIATTLSGTAVTFPTAFPNACTGVIMSCNTGDIAGAYGGASSISASGFTATSATATSETFFWMAIGY